MTRHPGIALGLLLLGCSGTTEEPIVVEPASSDGTAVPSVAAPPSSPGAAPSANAGAGGSPAVVPPDGLPSDSPSGTSGAPPQGEAQDGQGGDTGEGGGTTSAGSGGFGAVAGSGGAGLAGGDQGNAGGGAVVVDATVIDQLNEYLAEDPASRPELPAEPFATVPLSADQAELAAELLFQDWAERVRSERREENDAREITLGDFTLRYDSTTFGEAPETGRSLFLSLHGGGETDAATNDSQWENQKTLYQPSEGIYLSPRAPTDTWNMWHQDHIDALFTRLVANLIVFENVDPNRVYAMGYSAGGDGVYQIGPRMADSWAAAAMMAGHPNDAQPLSLRNIGFAIHVGEEDTSFERSAIGADWGLQLDALQDQDPEGYEHQVEIHAGKGHWMDLEDAVAVPWMESFTRNPVPDRVIWLQDDVPHDRFYWLALGEADRAAGVLVEASFEGQGVQVEGSGVSGPVEILLSDAMLDLDQTVTVSTPDGAELFSGQVDRTIANLHRTLEGRGDPALVFSGAVSVRLP